MLRVMLDKSDMLKEIAFTGELELLLNEALNDELFNNGSQQAVIDVINQHPHHWCQVGRWDAAYAGPQIIAVQGE